jgi:hypothetical protein
VPTWSTPAHAQGFFSKRPRPNPAERVPHLIVLVKTDPDERKRSQAAEELSNFDARTFAEIVPVLVDVAQHDQKPGVRQEALNSLARIRPVSQAAGQALERAAAQDDSWRIRLQAKSALMKYHLAGYSSSGKTEPNTPVRNVTTAEPPLLDPPPTTSQAPVMNRPAPPQFPASAYPARPIQETPQQPRNLIPAPSGAGEVEGPSLPSQR